MLYEVITRGVAQLGPLGIPEVLPLVIEVHLGRAEVGRSPGGRQARAQLVV